MTDAVNSTNTVSSTENIIPFLLWLDIITELSAEALT